MKKESYESIKEELLNYANDEIENWAEHQQLEDFDNADVLHNLFNNDYYITGYYQCAEWLKMHNVRELEAMRYIIEMEELNLGESNFTTNDMNEERIVNLLVYYLSWEIENEIEGIYKWYQIKQNNK